MSAERPVPTPGRVVTLRLYDQAGRRLGDLRDLVVEDPWWHRTQPVAEAASRHLGTEVRILRLIAGQPGPPDPRYGWVATHAGTVTYAAELVDPPATGLDLTAPATAEPEPDEPRRLPWARPGGTARILAAADALLASAGRPRTGPATQVRTSGLSSILLLPTGAGPVWCKSVPAFFAHEGRVLAWLQEVAPPGLVPTVIGRDDATATVLLADIPGTDQHDPDEAMLARMVDALVDLQARTASAVPELLALGVPDQRGPTLLPALRTLVARPDAVAGLTAAEVAAARRLVDDLPGRLAALAGCGLPDTLLHGDCHQGNWRSDGSSLTLLDWGDSAVGHPLLDVAAFAEHVTDPDLRRRTLDRFADRWSAHLPDADPAAALRLVAPVAALRQALPYQTFLDAMEPSEAVYFANEVPLWLRRAVSADPFSFGR